MKAVHYLDLRQSMRNGGGPACLRQRISLTDAERAAVKANVFYSPGAARAARGVGREALPRPPRPRRPARPEARPRVDDRARRADPDPGAGTGLRLSAVTISGSRRPSAAGDVTPARFERTGSGARTLQSGQQPLSQESTMDPLKPTTTAYPNRSHPRRRRGPTSSVGAGATKTTVTRRTRYLRGRQPGRQLPAAAVLRRQRLLPRQPERGPEGGRQYSVSRPVRRRCSRSSAAVPRRTTRSPASMDSGAPAVLSKLHANPPIPGARTEHVEYRSTIAHVPPEAAFRHVLEHPNEFFGASGITLHPPTDRLADGARVFLQEPGVTPPVWAPVEVRVNPQTQQIQFNTLDGHPLRGTNAFTFSPDGEGGTRVHQVSDFQLSSVVASGGSIAAGTLGQLGRHVHLPVEVEGSDRPPARDLGERSRVSFGSCGALTWTRRLSPRAEHVRSGSSSTTATAGSA